MRSNHEAVNRTDAQAPRAQLNARWDDADARIAREIRERGTLPEGDLSEDEIARIAVDVTTGGGERPRWTPGG